MPVLSGNRLGKGFGNACVAQIAADGVAVFMAVVDVGVVFNTGDKVVAGELGAQHDKILRVGAIDPAQHVVWFGARFLKTLAHAVDAQKKNICCP